MKTQYINCYKDRIFLKDFEDEIIKNYCSENIPETLVAENACVLPFRSKDENSIKGFGGVVDCKGRYIKESALEIEGIMPTGYEISEQISISNTRVVYLGYFMKQWGHFLVDFLPRVWWLLEHDKETQIIYLSKDKETIIEDNYLAVLELIGVKKERIHRVENITRYKEVVIPELALKRPYYWTETYRQIINRIVSEVPVCRKMYDKIYWTRTQFSKAQDTEIGEKELEKLFRKNGYKVLAPEQCTVEEQIYLFSHCKEFVALSGTIPHNIVFAGASCVKRNSPCTVTILNKTHRINTIQLLLNDFARAKIINVDCNYGLLPVSPAAGPFWVGVNKNVKRYAMERNMTLNEKHFFHGMRTRRDYIRYCLMYARIVQDRSIDLDGVIVGSSRPFSEEKTVELIWHHYREQLGKFPTFVSLGRLAGKIIVKIKTKLWSN